MSSWKMAAGITAIMVAAGCSDDVAQLGTTQSQVDRGLLALQENRLPQAKLELERVIVQEPNNPYARLGLGVLWAEAGNKDLARWHFVIARQNGTGAPIRTAVQRGSWRPVETTVADVAAQNLQLVKN